MIGFNASDEWYKKSAENENEIECLSAGFEPLGNEFAKVYWDNAWNLYE